MSVVIYKEPLNWTATDDFTCFSTKIDSEGRVLADCNTAPILDLQQWVHDHIGDADCEDDGMFRWSPNCYVEERVYYDPYYGDNCIKALERFDDCRFVLHLEICFQHDNFKLEDAKRFAELRLAAGDTVKESRE